ncbi:LysR family transcriptional regulator [Paracoccus litorisediminis]|uniref:LysR family transcriptional regulator n=1 Tax=Paracoccus litorisediminis TaxID=2006130 RepID=A0A844HSE4_9RHOB|nr:LysR family transcriptional regulator [Paracoccus litorisediminis]MTH60472.1 LysR family transcriptional regulator [Paracoccus litorisediminis]
MKISGSDLHLFRVFDSVVRNNGLSAAQVELSLSQPTISNHLTALEQRLGVKLCERGRRGFALTDKGRVVHEIGLEVLAGLEMQSRRLSQLRGALTGIVRIGIVDCVASDPNCHLSEVLARIARDAPMIEVELGIMRPGDISAALAKNELDIGIGGFDSRLGVLSYASLYQEQHLLYCAQGNPLFSVPDATIDRDLCYAQPWVHRGYWGGRRQLSFQRIDADRIVYDIEAQLMMILSGAYVGLLPVHLAESMPYAARLRRLPVENDDYLAAIELATRGGRLAKSVSYVRDLLVEAHGQHLQQSI